GTRAYGYDAAGNQILSVDRDGRAVRVAYDALNRPVSENWYADVGSSASLQTYSYVYDEGSRLLGAGDSQAYATYDYDGLDRMRNEEWSGLGTPLHLYHD